jgi:hypothetical protein
VLHLLRGAPPEDQAIARINIVTVLLRAVELHKMFVQYPPAEVVGQDLCLLLAVPGLPVELISLLKLALGSELVVSHDAGHVMPTGSLWVACISPSYGLLVTGVAVPERSSNATLAICYMEGA